MLSLSTLKMKFYQISSNISGSIGWHWTEEITDRFALLILFACNQSLFWHYLERSHLCVDFPFAFV